MSIRKKCQQQGHKFQLIEGVSLPYVFCSRWRCNGCAVAVTVPQNLAVGLHNAIPREDRFPQVELNADGRII